MVKVNKKAFTLIELLVVIAIIGILATLAVVALQQARSRARDSKRVADVKQLQTALELFFNENGRYPTQSEWDSGKIVSGSSGETFMYSIPVAPTPADGDCLTASNTYQYVQTNSGASYEISFCIGQGISNLGNGAKCLTPGGITAGACGSTAPIVGVCNPACGDGYTCDGGVCIPDGWFEVCDIPGPTSPTNWTSVSSSSDGNKIVAIRNYNNQNFFSVSSDGGLTWEKRDPDSYKSWYLVSSSADGSKLVATVWNGYIYTSSDFGATWTERTSAGSGYWDSLASSADGTKIIASINGGYLYVSTDSGVTWSEKLSDSVRNWESVAMSSDGTKMVALDGWGGYVYTSSDSGANWVVQTSAGQKDWYAVSSSSDGNNLIAATYGGYLYTSSDSGVTWVERISSGERDWETVSSSSDGSKLVAAVGWGGVFIYFL